MAILVGNSDLDWVSFKTRRSKHREMLWYGYLGCDALDTATSTICCFFIRSRFFLTFCASLLNSLSKSFLSGYRVSFLQPSSPGLSCILPLETCMDV